MKHKPTGNSIKRVPGVVPSTHKPVKPVWDELPHKALLAKSWQTLEWGSLRRSLADATRHFLKCRLQHLDPSDHRRYIEVQGQRLVEQIRAVRDQYRRYLEDKREGSTARINWMTFRFAIVPQAVHSVRTAACDYVRDSRVNPKDWHLLFGFPTPPVVVPLGSAPAYVRVPESDATEEFVTAVSQLVNEQAFQRITAGGPFGIEGQTLLAKSRLNMHSGISVAADIEHRQKLWQECRPWTEGLALLFDVAREELLFQESLLPEEARNSQASFLSLTEFQQIVYRHLVEIARPNSARLGEEGWLRLLQELDRKQISLDKELKGSAKQVLDEIRKNRTQVKSWTECYQRKLSTSLESGRRYSLRREITHFIHNEVKNIVRRVK